MFDLHFLKLIFLDCEEANSNSHNLTWLCEGWMEQCVWRGWHGVKGQAMWVAPVLFLLWNTFDLSFTNQVVRSVAIPGNEVKNEAETKYFYPKFELYQRYE